MKTFEVSFTIEVDDDNVTESDIRSIIFFNADDMFWSEDYTAEIGCVCVIEE